MNGRNIYLYWVGDEYKLIKILRNLIHLHSTNGKGYNVILITDKNIEDYIDEIPHYFVNLCPAHQADFVRVHVICKFGGIWMDSDTLVIDSLDSLFDILDNQNGFFIKENNTTLMNGLFGSRKNTPLMIQWKREMLKILEKQNGKIRWTDIGSSIINNIYTRHPEVFNNYKIFNGLDNLYPVNWDNCVQEYIQKPYTNYKNIIRNYQPLIVLVNSVYKILEDKSEYEILNGNMPMNFFINKSFRNLSLKNQI